MRFSLLLMCALMFAACQPAAPNRAAQIADAVEAIAAEHPEATIAVAVRDASTETMYDRNADRLFHAASTMKIPVMIEVYRRIHEGTMALDDTLLVKNEFRSIVDGSLFSIEDDSDDAIYEQLGQYKTVGDLVYDAIIVSSNLATNLLIDTLTADSVQATMEGLGTTQMQVLRGVEDIKAFRQGLSNRATAADLAIQLEALRQGQAVSPEHDRAMLEVLLDQRFNDMIPAGLPAGTPVAHKTGWITSIHHDAALVMPTDAEPYTLVILTEGFEDDAVSARVGAAIAEAVHGVLR
ncbi:MAG: serine hydrolase [Bacteroidota bacterium]